MGLLAAGLAGASKEYLKQSDEQRADDRQRIRDERLNEFERGNIEYRAELTTQENIRKEGVLSEAAEAERKERARQSQLDRESTERREAAQREFEKGNYSARLDENVYRDGQLVQQGTRAPSSASTAAAQQLFRMGPGGEKGAATTFEKLMDQYFKDPDVWTKEKRLNDFDEVVEVSIPKEGAPTLIDYVNRNLHPDSQITTDLQSELQKSPERMWTYAQQRPEFNVGDGAQRAIESIKKLFPEWNPPGHSGGVTEGTSMGIIE